MSTLRLFSPYQLSSTDHEKLRYHRTNLPHRPKRTDIFLTQFIARYITSHQTSDCLLSPNQNLLFTDGNIKAVPSSSNVCLKEFVRIVEQDIQAPSRDSNTSSPVYEAAVITQPRRSINPIDLRDLYNVWE